MSAQSNKRRSGAHGNENARSAANNPIHPRVIENEIMNPKFGIIENDGSVGAANRPLRQNGSTGSHHAGHGNQMGLQQRPDDSNSEDQKRKKAVRNAGLDANRTALTSQHTSQSGSQRQAPGGIAVNRPTHQPSVGVQYNHKADRSHSSSHAGQSVQARPSQSSSRVLPYDGAGSRPSGSNQASTSVQRKDRRPIEQQYGAVDNQEARRQNQEARRSDNTMPGMPKQNGRKRRSLHGEAREGTSHQPEASSSRNTIQDEESKTPLSIPVCQAIERMTRLAAEYSSSGEADRDGPSSRKKPCNETVSPRRYSPDSSTWLIDSANRPSTSRGTNDQRQSHQLPSTSSPTSSTSQNISFHPNSWIPSDFGKDREFLFDHWIEFCSLIQSGVQMDPMPDNWILGYTDEQQLANLKRWKLMCFIDERRKLTEKVIITEEMWQDHFAKKRNSEFTEAVEKSKLARLAQKDKQSQETWQSVYLQAPSSDQEIEKMLKECFRRNPIEPLVPRLVSRHQEIEEHIRQLNRPPVAKKTISRKEPTIWLRHKPMTEQEVEKLFPPHCSSSSPLPTVCESSVPLIVQNSDASSSQSANQPSPMYYEQVASTSQASSHSNSANSSANNSMHQQQPESARPSRKSTSSRKRRSSRSDASMDDWHHRPSSTTGTSSSENRRPLYEEVSAADVVKCGGDEYRITEWTSSAPHGKFGWVAFGKCCQTSQDVAIKIIRKSGGSKEIEILKGLKNRRVVELYGHTTKNDLEFLVMERMEKTLGDLIKTAPKSGTLVFIQWIGRQILGALAYLKGQNILHTHLKLENLMVRKNGSRWIVKLIDFGNSVDVGETGSVRSKTTASSLRYGSPEALLDGRLSFPTDMWSFGILCLDMWMKRSFFHANKLEEMLHAICDTFGRPQEELKGAHLFKSHFEQGEVEWKPIKEPVRTWRRYPALMDIRKRSTDDDTEFGWFKEMIGAINKWDASARPTTEEALSMQFFTMTLGNNQ